MTRIHPLPIVLFALCLALLVVVMGPALLAPASTLVGSPCAEAPPHLWGLWTSTVGLLEHGPFLRVAEAGFPGGEGFPRMRVLYNTVEKHKQIAAVLQAQWKENLGIDVELENREWKTYLSSMHAQEYDIARGGWIGDYLDPNTFLEIWLTGGPNNETGWSSAEYDSLIAQAGREPDVAERMHLLAEAEAVLNEEMPLLPLYWYVWQELRQPDVRGLTANPLDHHPLRHVWLDR